MESKEKALKIVKILDEKKAESISCIKIDEMTVLADYFVICTASGTTHVNALFEEVDHMLSLEGIEPLSKGDKAANWKVMDYEDVIVHIFTPDSRSFYNLDEAWSSGENISLNKIVLE